MTDVKVIAGLDRRGSSGRGSKTRARRWSPVDWRRPKVVASFAVGDVLTSVGAMAVLAAGLQIMKQPGLALDGTAFLGAASLLISLGLLFGLYETCRLNPIELFRRRVQASSIFCGFLIIVVDGQVWSAAHALSWILLVPATVVLGSLTVGGVELVLKRLGLWQTRLVLIGDLSATQDLSVVLDSHPGLGVRVLARVPADDPRLADPLELASERADMAVLMSSGNCNLDAQRASTLNFPSVIIARDVGDVQSLWSNTRMIGSAIGIEVRRSPVRHDRLLKRAIDLAVGCCLLTCCLPVIAVSAATVWLIDRHNPFYSQTRLGLGDRRVRVWKIRSMFVDAEARLNAHLASDAGARAEWARSYKLRQDPRILPGIGQFIRRTSLDELPQFWNVIRGDMSLVGPRPFPTYHLDSFDEAFRKLRASVMPGLTGFWQITSRSDGDLSVQQSADEFYVRNRSLWLDLYILLHTLPAVVFGKGAR